MCGIAGQFLHGDVTPDSKVLAGMAEALRYRGPDDEGLYRTTHIGLVHRRLSIRDLSDAGHCPMASLDGLMYLVFNGEIYNWRELRTELESGGALFQSQSDTEVILHGYRVWGNALFGRLRGMFALAIWDASRRCLLLARDRAGEKPLFYRTSSEGLVFASSLEALRPGGVLNTIDPVGVVCHLVHSFIPASHTVWQGVQVLPPAHYLEIECGQLPVLTRYWEFPRSGPLKRSLHDCEQTVEAALDDSVARCLDADVPVGVFLSGGADSSLIAALAARHCPGIPAFSLGFREARHNELPYARRVAKHLGLEHVTFDLNVEDAIEWLPHLVTQYGQPFGDSSSLPSYGVARLARQSVKVCLSGDGGDESFGGYWRLQSGVYAARYGRWMPRIVRKRIIPNVASRLGGVGRRWLAVNALSLQVPGVSYTNRQSWFERLGDLAGPALLPALAEDLAGLRVGKTVDRPEVSLVQRLLYDDFQVQLPDAYLTKVDVASMAASLEVRAPFLDQRVLELAWSLPDSTKLHWGRRKWLLKRIAARHVPAEVVYRPKMGFGMPLPQWFRGALGEYLEVLMSDSLAVGAGWILAGPVRTCLAEHRAGLDHSTRLWLILWFELWLRLVEHRAGAVDMLGRGG
ncbi:asparagine synthase (glutamine-hydrolyzing) [uncultured Thiodictyon sp.]|uniref:asparagine synthase (glutamine-hydrolyzing) n=1 Tax=uncultured Thiodictyon sp. TaxID=1846217 RepID=UPI0025EBA255|nr:asparagine synthase (glutamine-hydrolyzing) [uncultured Thiodictyon sp.]